MKLPVLLYHKIDRIPPGARYPRSYVTTERFDAQLALLRRCGYESVSFADYLAYRRGGGGVGRAPRPTPFAVGHPRNPDGAPPPFQRAGCPPPAELRHYGAVRRAARVAAAVRLRERFLRGLSRLPAGGGAAAASPRHHHVRRRLPLQPGCRAPPVAAARVPRHDLPRGGAR